MTKNVTIEQPLNFVYTFSIVEVKICVLGAHSLTMEKKKKQYQSNY